jgi:tetratricopeptide (TPR) repeat protein
MRIIGAQLRSGETEYFFEHAVAQEVIYRSILVQSRKAIHSAVGHAIEDLYRDRIEEFYPTLAYHYSQSGELELAEQYLIEAGNAALESSASSEALNLFHEALQSYISRAPGTLDQEKIAMLNERIARAYRYKGYHAAATDHFAQALTSLGENVSEVHRVKRSIYLLMSLLRISSYYLYGYKRAKRIPSSDEIRRIHLLYWMLTSAAMSKSYRLDRCVRLLTKNLSDVGYKQVPVAARLYLSARSSMTLDGWSGFFTRFISRRMERFVIADDPIVKLTHEFDRVIYFSAIGEWDVPCRMALVDTNLKRGEMQMPNCYLYWHGLLCIEKGDADQIQKLLAESDRIRSFYDNDEAQLTSCMIRTRYHIKSREYESAIHQGRVALAISEKIGLGVLQFWTLGQIAQAQISLDRDEEASSLLDQMRRWIKEAKPFPFALITYHIARLKQRIRAIESGDGSRTRRASSSGETAFHTVSRIHSLSNKWKVEQTESLKLMGTYHWLSGRRAKAMRWWSRAIDVGGKLGAELEVARTRLEMGLRIGNHSPDGSSHRRALAIESLRGAADYFERAGLSADLYEARGIIRRIGG